MGQVNIFSHLTFTTVDYKTHDSTVEFLSFGLYRLGHLYLPISPLLLFLEPKSCNNHQNADSTLSLQSVPDDIILPKLSL